MASQDKTKKTYDVTEHTAYSEHLTKEAKGKYQIVYIS